MSEKKRIAVSLSPDNVEWLDENYNNRSGYIDDLLTKARKNGGDTDTILRNFEKRKLEFELKKHEQQMELVEEQIEVLDKADTREEREYRDSLTDLIDTIQSGGRLWPGHQQVGEIATDHGKTTDEVLEDVREQCPNADASQFEKP